jgi:hypothetical protein
MVTIVTMAFNIRSVTSDRFTNDLSQAYQGIESVNILDLVPPPALQGWTEYKDSVRSGEIFKVLRSAPQELPKEIFLPEGLTGPTGFTETFAAGYDLEWGFFSLRSALAHLPETMDVWTLRSDPSPREARIPRESAAFWRTSRSTPLSLWLRLLVHTALPRGALPNGSISEPNFGLDSRDALAA